MQRAFIRLALGGVVVLGACDRDEGSATEPPAAPQSQQPSAKGGATRSPGDESEEAAEPERALEPLDMLGHFDAASEALDALIRMDGASFHGALERLENADPPGLDQYASFSETLTRYAKQGRASEDPSVWGQALGSIAATCGDCHRTVQNGPSPPPAPAPEDERGLGSHMRRHQWAVDRMWEGLFVPDERAWVAGAEVMYEHPVQVPEGILEPGQRPRFVKLARKVHQLGKRAATTPAGPERAAHFGELVVTCGQCHRMVGSGGRAP